MNWKKIITWTLVIFALYTVISAPDRAAEIVNSAFDMIAEGGQSVAAFFDQLVA
jgi:hypothetical protein